ncbi:MAG TPA: cytochrome ubiquinol oxidase subunit I [Pilimelia sp.]|nr:cytochrome ubiquinol oxidase subunit I [Pilimelia sp.]
MDALDLARWQFGVTTVYHFLFVPITIGLSFLVAMMQTAWMRTGDERWLRLTKFYGKLFLINFAMGVVTGIVQEFQFGMNWSDYSRFVGDIFGAPLAIEALLAFFLESTFLGLWIFGWERLPKRIHLACIWLVAIGTVLSAYFILAANSWMQHPVGFRFNPQSGRAELSDFGAVLTNKVALVTFPHTVAGCFLTAGGLVTAVALWHLIRGRDAADRDTADRDTAAFRSALKLGAWTTLAAAVAVVVTGDIQGKIMTDVQPMKMAAAEALYETEQPAAFSLFTIGTLDGSEEIFAVKVPGLLSWLATGSFDGQVQGINDLQAQYAAQYGPGDYTPNIPVTYWTFRLMIGLGLVAALVALWGLWAARRGRTPASRWLLWAGLVLPLLPLAANAFGWIFTEMGRQPWVVFSQMRTADGVSPGVASGEVVTSLAVFTLLYGVLAIVEVGLLLRFARMGLPDVGPAPEEPGADRPLAFAY